MTKAAEIAAANPKSPVRVAVTGVGAIIGQGIVRSLRLSDRPVHVVGIDRNAESLGPQFCDAFYAKPTHNESSEEYIAFWNKLLTDENIDLVLPGLEVDVFFLDSHRDSLNKQSAVLGLNQTKLINLARDKWRMGLELDKLDMPVIPAVLSDDWEVCKAELGEPPFLLKPREGNGSRGMAQIHDVRDLEYWSRKSGENYMIQKLIGSDDEEYTVGAFGFGDGESLDPIVFKRRLSGAGNTQYAEVIEHKVIENAVRKLSAHFKPLGPTNYQFRMEDGIAYLLEINPRLSSSTSLRAGFGYNEAEMSLGFYLDNAHPKMPKVTKGRGWRYSEDFLKS